MASCTCVRISVSRPTQLLLHAWQAGTKVVVVPGGHVGTVRSVEVGGTAATVARAGDAADVTLNGVEASAVAAGSVVCAAGWAVSNVAQFEARVLVLGSAGPLLRGQAGD